MKPLKQNILLFATITFILLSCNSGKEQISKIKFEKELVQEELQQMNQTNDSLKTIIHGLEGTIERYQHESAIESMVSPEEMPIRNLVDKVHQGWEALVKEKDVNALLGNFLPYYSAHAVRIDIENIPSVSRSNETDFTDHLVAVTEVDGLSVIFGEPQFFYTEVRGNLFSTCYRVLMKLYINGELQETKSIISLVAGEDRDGWKVGSYAWVTFDY